MTDKTPGRQYTAWLLVALFGPILSTVGHTSWLGVLPIALICPLLYPSVNLQFPKWFCIAEIIWLIVFLGNIAPLSGTCWESAGNPPNIPIIIMFLAAWAASGGSERASRVGATLFWLVIPMLLIVILAGLADVKIKWITTKPEMPDGTLLCVLLVPVLSIFLPEKSGKIKLWMLALGLLAVVASLLLEATMGTDNMKLSANSFYAFSKGISLFGIAERFEPLVACALTIGWFALLCMIFSAVYHLSDKIHPAIAKWSVWSVGVAGMTYMCTVPKAGEYLVIGCLIFWVFLPLLTQVLVACKKDEKK